MATYYVKDGLGYSPVSMFDGKMSDMDGNPAKPGQEVYESEGANFKPVGTLTATGVDLTVKPPSSGSGGSASSTLSLSGTPSGLTIGAPLAAGVVPAGSGTQYHVITDGHSYQVYEQDGYFYGSGDHERLVAGRTVYNSAGSEYVVDSGDTAIAVASSGTSQQSPAAGHGSSGTAGKDGKSGSAADTPDSKKPSDPVTHAAAQTPPPADNPSHSGSAADTPDSKKPSDPVASGTAPLSAVQAKEFGEPLQVQHTTGNSTKAQPAAATAPLSAVQAKEFGEPAPKVTHTATTSGKAASGTSSLSAVQAKEFGEPLKVTHTTGNSTKAQPAASGGQSVQMLLNKYHETWAEFSANNQQLVNKYDLNEHSTIPAGQTANIVAGDVTNFGAQSGVVAMTNAVVTDNTQGSQTVVAPANPGSSQPGLGLAAGTTLSSYKDATIDGYSHAAVEKETAKSNVSVKDVLSEYKEDWASFSADNPGLKENGTITKGEAYEIRANHVQPNVGSTVPTSDLNYYPASGPSSVSSPPNSGTTKKATTNSITPGTDYGDGGANVVGSPAGPANTTPMQSPAATETAQQVAQDNGIASVTNGDDQPGLGLAAGTTIGSYQGAHIDQYTNAVVEDETAPKGGETVTQAAASYHEDVKDFLADNPRFNGNSSYQMQAGGNFEVRANHVQPNVTGATDASADATQAQIPATVVSPTQTPPTGGVAIAPPTATDTTSTQPAAPLTQDQIAYNAARAAGVAPAAEGSDQPGLGLAAGTTIGSYTDAHVDQYTQAVVEEKAATSNTTVASIAGQYHEDVPDFLADNPRFSSGTDKINTGGKYEVRANHVQPSVSGGSAAAAALQPGQTSAALFHSAFPRKSSYNVGSSAASAGATADNFQNMGRTIPPAADPTAAAVVAGGSGSALMKKIAFIKPRR